MIFMRKERERDGEVFLLFVVIILVVYNSCHVCL